MAKQDNSHTIRVHRESIDYMVYDLHEFMRRIHDKTDAIQPIQNALNKLVEVDIELEKAEKAIG